PPQVTVPRMAASLFRIPPIIHYGPGAFEQLGPTAQELGLRQVLLVTDRGMVALGVAAQGQRILEQAGVRVTLFDGVQPDPTLTMVEAGCALLPGGETVGIVAIGGGSPMDCAKAIAVRHGNGVLRPDWIGMEKVPRGGPPVIAVPTTAGTGSEVTRVM